MLFINDKRVSLDEAFEQIVGKGTKTDPITLGERNYGKKNVFTILHENLRYHEKAKKVVTCAGVSVEAFCQVTLAANKHSIVELRYARNQRAKAGLAGEFTYTPENIDIPSSGVLEVDNDAELSFFLSMHSRSLNSGNNQNDVTKKFMKFVKGDRSKKELDKQKYIQRIKALVMGDTSLPKSDVLLWAKSIQRMNIPNFFIDVDSMDYDEVQLEMLRLTDAHPENVKLAFQSQDNQIRRDIDTAMKNKMLWYTKADLSWKMKLGDGEELVVCQFRQQDMKLDPIDLLIDFYIDPERDKRRLYSKLHTAVGAMVTH